MISFGQLYAETQAQVEDFDASSLVLIKRAINQGMRKFGAILNRDWRNREQTFSTVASQTYYQCPEDLIRIKSLTVTNGTTVYPLTEIVDEELWQSMVMRPQTSGMPMYYFVKGNDQFGIYPALSGVFTGTLTYEHSMRDMAADDYTTGTVTMTGGSIAVTGLGTIFSANMVGRVLFVTDGSADGMGYKISAFTGTTNISLENFYGGTTGSGKSYLIGEVPDIPEEYHEALIDYACYRYYRRRRDMTAAKEMLATFEDSLADCKENYSSKTSSQYFRSPRVYSGYVNRGSQDLFIP